MFDHLPPATSVGVRSNDFNTVIVKESPDIFGQPK